MHSASCDVVALVYLNPKIWPVAGTDDEPGAASSSGVQVVQAVTNSSWRMAKWMRSYLQLMR